MEQQSPDLPVACNNQKVNKAYKTTIFKILNHRQWRTVIPKKWKITEMSPINCPAYCLESFQATEEGMKAEGESGGLPDWGLGVWGDQGGQRSQSAGEGRVSCRENMKICKRFFQVFSRVLISICSWAKFQRPETVPISMSLVGKISQLRGPWVQYWEGICTSSEKKLTLD